MIQQNLRVVYSPLAEAELRTAWRHIAQHNVDAADQFLDAMHDRTESLRTFPDRGTPSPEFGDGIRFLIEGNYLIFYRREGSTVTILRVLHSSRNLEQLFEE